jgi:hypothetical protein
MIVFNGRAIPRSSATHKHDTGELVLRWVTTRESSLLYVLLFLHLVRLKRCVVPSVLLHVYSFWNRITESERRAALPILCRRTDKQTIAGQSSHTIALALVQVQFAFQIENVAQQEKRYKAVHARAPT